jgi:cell division protein FtsB
MIIGVCVQRLFIFLKGKVLSILSFQKQIQINKQKTNKQKSARMESLNTTSRMLNSSIQKLTSISNKLNNASQNLKTPNCKEMSLDRADSEELKTAELEP